MDYEQFITMVQKQAGLDRESAERAARAVFYALGRAMTSEEVVDMAAELPMDFAPLVAQAQRLDIEVMPADELINRVAQRTGLDTDHAIRAVEAVLETLGERISGGEVDDLIAQLPEELHAPLKRGTALSHGAARKMPLEEFLRLVSEREGVTIDQAREHARAVFATLREAVTEKEYSDITSQLPEEFSVILARP